MQESAPHTLQGGSAMTLDDLSNAQFTLLTLVMLGCIYLVTVVIGFAADKRRE
jgi:hypothetical protein